MSGGWKDSNRRDELPPDWAERVAAVHKRSGGRCEFEFRPGQRCPARATGGVDHWVAPDDHRLESLKDLCKGHHDRKTQREALAGRRQNKIQPRIERHPGAIR